MACPVCNDEGTVEVEVYRRGKEREVERRPCSAPSCLAAALRRVFKVTEG
jgi:hypothetical protein